MENQINKKEQRTLKSIIKTFFSWLALIALTIFGGAYFVSGALCGWNGWLDEVVREHVAATIGLPSAALLSLCIVLFLEYHQGTIEFEGLGFKFRGASGPIVLWVFCFLAITLGIKLLW